MEIRVLQYFMAVARHENITKAAEELHLTQLTEAGLIFKARAQAMKHHELDHYFGSAAEKIEVAGTYNLLYNTIFFIEEAWAVRFASRAWRMP